MLKELICLVRRVDKGICRGRFAKQKKEEHLINMPVFRYSIQSALLSLPDQLLWLIKTIRAGIMGHPVYHLNKLGVRVEAERRHLNINLSINHQTFDRQGRQRRSEALFSCEISKTS